MFFALPRLALLEGGYDEQGAIILALPAFGLLEGGYDEQGAIVCRRPHRSPVVIPDILICPTALRATSARVSGVH